MSRHGAVQRTVRQEKEYMENVYSDEEDDNQDNYDFTEQQWEMIVNLCEIGAVKQDRAIKALQYSDGDFDKALSAIQKEQQKDKDKLLKKEKEEKEKAEKTAIRAEKEVEKNALNELNKKKSGEYHQPVRKISSSDEPVARRKSSNIVQEYETDHYNTTYPSLEVAKDIKPSKTINIVVVGHVDSGKSTLVGNLLQEIKFLSKKEIHTNERISKQMGKQSFKYAFVTDEMQEQRIRGVTIDVGVKRIELQDRLIVFLDSPGHRDFIPNMITGAAQADYAVLVIDVTHFQSIFISGGQTKEHAYIVKSLGVSKIIVAVNKMDLVGWKSEPFEKIKGKLNYYLLKIGFKEDSIVYVPMSAFQGLNIVRTLKQPFQSAGVLYKESVIDVIKGLSLPIRPVDKPFRMNITNFYESPMGRLKGHCISGKIEGGVLRRDDKYVILPQNCQCLVKEILVNNEKVNEAIVGDNVEVQLKLIDETFFQTIKFGNVLSSLKFSIPVSRKFVVEALALDLDVPILRGTQVVIYIGANKSPARITKINYIFDPHNGMIIKKNPKSIRSNDCAQIEIETESVVCVELFANYKTFGRVIIRQKKDTLCVGTIKLIR